MTGGWIYWQVVQHASGACLSLYLSKKPDEPSISIDHTSPHKQVVRARSAHQSCLRSTLLQGHLARQEIAGYSHDVHRLG